MKEAKQVPRSVFLLTVLTLSILLLSNQACFKQPQMDQRLPKEIAEVPLPKLLDFGTDNCPPCKLMAPVLKELAEEYKGRVVIKVIEVYEEKDLTKAYRIRVVPTQIFFDSKNQEVFRHEGPMDKGKIKKAFQKIGVQ